MIAATIVTTVPRDEARPRASKSSATPLAANVRREVLMVADPSSIDAVRNSGFTIISERPLTAFGETLARIRVRRGRSVEQVISELQALAPLASIAPHHLFRPSADETSNDDCRADQKHLHLPATDTSA